MSIGYMNMQDGRNNTRGGDLEEQMSKEDYTVYGLAEMHLRDTGEPPHIPGYTWEGCNISGKDPKGGGVGALICGKDWVRVSENC